LAKSPHAQLPHSMSPDGTGLVVRENMPDTGLDLTLLTLDGRSTALGVDKRQTQPLVQAAQSQVNGEIAPDGHWLAYQSDESGRSEIYVRPFPNTGSGRWQISTAGGTRPVWARSGRELFYLDSSGLLTAVPVQLSPMFTAGNPTKLLETAYYSGPTYRTYDVSPDGQRFLMIKENAGGDQNTAPASMVVVLNWTEELKQRVPTK
jgi:Tol biopolymer transport system component